MKEPKMNTKRSVKWLRPSTTDVIVINKGAPVIWDKITRQHHIDPKYFNNSNLKADAIKYGCPIHYNNVDSDVMYWIRPTPEDCRFCGMRTAFEEINKLTQFHTCQHCGAGYFVTLR